MKNTSYYLLIVLALVTTYLFLSIVVVRNRLADSVSAKGFVPLDHDMTFDARVSQDNFNILKIPVKNPGLVNNEAYTLSLQSNGREVRRFDFSGFNVGEFTNLKFQFDPIADSKDVVYQVKFLTSGTQPPLFVGTADDSVAYEAYFRTVNKGEVVKQIIGTWRRRILENFGFFGLWAVLLFGVSVWGTRNEK